MDYQPAVAQRAGIGRYTRVLAEQLVRTAGSDDRLRLFYLDFSRKAATLDVPGAELVPHRLFPGRVLQRMWRHVGWPAFDDLAGPADVYHFTNFILPPLRRGKSVVTIFDMSFERFPQFAEDRNLRFLRAGIRNTVARADAIITISQFSSDEIEALLPASKGKLHPIPLGISQDFRRPPDADIGALRKSLGLERPYLLTVGTIEPRKNLPFLVDVFERLAGTDVDLVIAGMPGWKCEPILARFADSRRADRIRYVQYVPDGGLAALYAGAELFVVPSFYEGFGFPPLEAMACGTPVVSSAGGSLPEVLGDAALVLQGFDADHWAAEVGQLLSDSLRRKALATAGVAQAARYRWETTARQTWDVYRGVQA
jgi:glycosyltransferase involved in cell wall biosynthesis